MKFFMLIGLPGVGKSTFRKGLVEKIPTIAQVSSDDYIDMVAKTRGLTYRDVFEESIKPAEQYANDKLHEAVLSYNNIVVDRTNLSVKSRAKVLKLIPPHYEKIAVWVVCPDPEEHARRLNRPGKDIPDHIMTNMRNSFQQPMLSEGFNEVYQATSFESFWISHSRSQMNK